MEKKREQKGIGRTKELLFEEKICHIKRFYGGSKFVSAVLI